MQDHVVDQVVHIEQVGVGWVKAAVRIIPLQALVGGGRTQPGIRQRHELFPGCPLPPEELIEILDDVPVLRHASLVGSLEVVIGPLGRIVEPPVETVDIQVHVVVVPGEITHGQLAVFHPQVAGIGRIPAPIA